MGRGRQKAKHTKVARALKYSVPDTNYSELERELTGRESFEHSEDELSKWSEYLDENDDDDFEDDVQQRRA